MVLFCYIWLYCFFRWGGVKDLYKSIFPVFTHRNWYFTCYIVLCFLSCPINFLISKINKKQFETLLIILLFWFSILPTFFYYEIMDDRGKGLINIIILYLLGRYIRLYFDDIHFSRRKWVAIALGCFAIISLLNGGISLFTGTFKNPFARDNSIFIIIEAISVFIVFKDMKIQSKAIPRIASCVPACFLLDECIRHFILQCINLHQFSSKVLLTPIIILIALCIFSISFVIHTVYDNSLRFLFETIFSKIQSILGNSKLKKVIRVYKSIEDIGNT